ncbi:MAG: PHP domain-containing protein [Deltaproteobacteria bacterium]|nr:PHP domain-containing protein [Deltaproteobacteria bacterium]
MPQRVDLHTHSTASDGTLEPGALVALAREWGLVAIALTDHDCMDGLAEASRAGRRFGVEVVPGVELSTRRPFGSLHVLGYWIDEQHVELCAALAAIRGGRQLRNERILARLAVLGMELDAGRVRALAGGEVIGRPHIAKAMQAAGWVGSVDEAFERYLGSGRPAYVPRLRLEPPEAIALVHAAGGLAVLAHPGIAGLEPPVLEAEIESLAACGLDGLEAIYPEHSEAQRRELERLAGRLGLAVTGGSDFHGELKPNRLGEPPVPAELLEALRARRVGR